MLMKILLTVMTGSLLFLGAALRPGHLDRLPPEDSGLTESHIEFLKDHGAYEDFMEAFYPERVDL